MMQVPFVLRLMLALIFLFSSLAKLRNPSAFVREVSDYQVLPQPLARLFGRLLPFVELITAVLLLSGFLLIVGTGMAAFLLTSFTVVMTVMTTRGRQPKCNCFGTASTSHVGWQTILRNLLLLIPVVWLFVTLVTGHQGEVIWPTGGLGADAEALTLAVLLTLTYVVVTEGFGMFVRLADVSGKAG